MWKKIFYFIVIITNVGIISCNRNPKSILIKQFYQKKIVFLDDLQTFINNKQIDNKCIACSSDKYKIMTFINGDCSICIDKLNDWSKFINEMKIYNVDFLIIINTNDLGLFMEVNERLKFPYSIIIDKHNSVRLKNQIPEIPDTDCFLLDSENRTLVIGDPIINHKIREIYIKVFNSRRKH
jgi:hypothetical protein